MSKGAQGNAHAKFIKENLMDPYNKAEQDLISAQVSVANDFAELKKQFPELTDEQLESYKGYNSSYSNTAYNSKADEDNTATVLDFEYKTYANQVHKIKKTATGLEKSLEKPDTFNPESNEIFDKVSRSIET